MNNINSNPLYSQQENPSKSELLEQQAAAALSSSPNTYTSDCKSERHDEKLLLLRIADRVQLAVNNSAASVRDPFNQNIPDLEKFLEVNKETIFSFIKEYNPPKSPLMNSKGSSKDQAIVAVTSAIKMFGIHKKSEGRAQWGITVPAFVIP